jgi:ubiquinone biosynthesis protein COQ4
MIHEKRKNPIVAKDASTLARLFMGLRALAILKNDAANPYYAALLHTSFDYETYARLADVLGRTAEGRQFLDEKRTIPGENIDIEVLSRLPKGTLGHEFAQYFIKNKLQPFTYEYPIANDGEFLYKRYRETHDIHHLITGYDVDVIGEVELQAFYFGNLGLLHAGFIAFTSILYQLSQTGLEFGKLRSLTRRLRAAYRRGKDSRELLSVRFDDLWDKQVSDLAQLICPPGPRYA